MSQRLRVYLIATVAIVYAYLLWHAREPLRLNIGDPWSDANVLSSIKYVKQYGFLATSFTDVLDVGPLTADSYHYIHYPPLAEIIYGAVGKFLGVGDIGTFRLFALVFSGAALWLLFQYTRRMYSDRIALIATMLLSTSLIWLMYADSIHQMPIMQASAFLALWGLVRAIETRQRRFYVASVIGSFACFLTSYDYWIFLPAAVLVTVYIKAGNPFARGQRHYVALCAAGCALAIVAKALAVIGAVGWNEFVADLRLQFFERSTSSYDRQFSSAIPTLLRRITMVCTPLAWIAIVTYGWRTLRAPSFVAAIKDSPAWMLVTALVFLRIFSQLAASQMLPTQVLLPFYAVGCAILIDGLLDAPGWRRHVALAWLVFAPAWGLFFTATQPRSVLDRDDVARANAYLAANDHNDFLFSNLISVGHIQATFDRHYWDAPASPEPDVAVTRLLETFEVTGADYAYGAIFLTPESRFIDKSLWPFAMRRQQWSVTGWPFLYRAKTNRLIRDVDMQTKNALTALELEPILRLHNFDLYRYDRASALAIAARDVPLATHIDFGSPTAVSHELLGWAPPHLSEPEGIAASPMTGYLSCGEAVAASGRANRCKTVMTSMELAVPQSRRVSGATLLLRLQRSCDAVVRIELARPTRLALAMNGFRSETALIATSAVFDVPASAVRAGINEVALENRLPTLGAAEVRSLDVSCR